MSVRKRYEDFVYDFQKTLGAARQGEQSELGVLLDVYRGYLLSIASEKLSHEVIGKVAPSDLVQETLMQAYRAFGEFRGTTEVELRTWLKQIIFRKVIDVHRYYRDFAVRDVSREISLTSLSEKGHDDGTVAAAAEPRELVRKAETIRTFDDALLTLEPDQRQAVMLHSIEQFSFEEVGVRMGCCARTARKLWTTAIRNLTSALQSTDSGG